MRRTFFLLSTTIFITGSMAPQANAQHSMQARAGQPEYSYGTLLVRRSSSSWQRERANAPAPAAAPRAVVTTAPAPEPAPVVTAEPPDMKMAPFYVPQMQEDQEPGPTVVTVTTPPPAAVPVATQAPMQQQAMARQLPQGQPPQPTPAQYAAYNEPLAPDPFPRVPQSKYDDTSRYVSGRPIQPHPGEQHRNEDGNIVFVGPSAKDDRYKPSWFKARFGNGYRTDDIEVITLSNAPPAGVARSETKEEWDGVSIYEVKGGLEYTHRESFLNGLHVEGEASYGKIIDGDADIAVENQLDDGTRVTSQQFSGDGGDGSVMGFQASVGYEFSPDFLGKRAHTSIIPMIGYALQQQDLERSDMAQIAPTPGLLTSSWNYETEWSGPFLGMKFGFEWPDHRLAFRGAYYYADYEADGNLIDPANPANNVRYQDEADAQGFSLGGNYSYNIYYGLEVFVDAAFQTWSTDSGTSTFTTASGVSFGRLDEVTWTSQSYQIGLSYRW